MDPKGIRVLTRIWSWFVLAFLYVPLLVIVIYAFNKDRIRAEVGEPIGSVATIIALQQQ